MFLADDSRSSICVARGGRADRCSPTRREPRVPGMLRGSEAVNELRMSVLRIAIGVLVSLLVAIPALVWVLMAPVVCSLAPPTGISVEPGRLREHVEFLSGGEVPRSYDHPERLDAVATYIEAEFQKAGLRPIRQTFEINGRIYSNVIARYGNESAARLVVGAHYDVYGHQPGADDNASGVAGLLELAHLLQEHQPPPGSAIELVAYTLEEPPFFMSERMGSAVHARSLAQSDADIIGHDIARNDRLLLRRARISALPRPAPEAAVSITG